LIESATRGPAAIDLEVQVRSGREAGAALEADHLAGVHERTVRDRDVGQQVRIADEVRLRARIAGQAGDGLDVYIGSEAASPSLGDVGGAVRHAVDWGTGRARQVDPGVEEHAGDDGLADQRRRSLRLRDHRVAGAAERIAGSTTALVHGMREHEAATGSRHPEAASSPPRSHLSPL
jgi:hypothetical protein